ncbi:MAG: NAD(P)/FAD-dependent oxidoreductase [Actinomycetes bacterium]
MTDASAPAGVVVLGASLAGLLAAAAAEAAGAAVTILERDSLPDAAAPRPGVPQGRQAHVLLHRGHLAAEALLPGLTDDVLAAGAVRIDSGLMPWLGEYGWLPQAPSYEILSLTRPLLELLVRRRLQTTTRVRLEDGSRATGLTRDGAQWTVATEAGERSADVVIDASGRSSRLPRWLATLGHHVAAPLEVDAQLGYACQVYRAVRPVPLRHGVMVAASPDLPRSGLALPVEQNRWLIIAAGYGRHRPTRSAADFVPFLGSLRDPAVRDLVQLLEPEGDLAVYRQTANRRSRYGRGRDWPDGLLVVGDALCAFDPIYGQGITVAACQAELLRTGLVEAGRPGGSRRLQRRLQDIVDLPWSVATSQDLRQPSCAVRPTVGQRASIAWSSRLGRLAAGGNATAVHAFSEVYHLMGSPQLMFAPALIRDVVRSEISGYPAPPPRPAELSALAPPRSVGRR